MIAVIDFETTGLIAGDDEVLQVSIIDEHGIILGNEYCKPRKKTELGRCTVHSWDNS